MGEKQKRQYLVGEALLLGYGGISLINRITGMSINAIRCGIDELRQGDVYECGAPERAPGAGRPKFTDSDTGILEAVEEIVSGATYGTPTRVLAWTTLSLRKISGILESEFSIRASHTTVGKALGVLGYSRQCNKKMEQVGASAPDRNEQFEYINAKAQEFAFFSRRNIRNERVPVKFPLVRLQSNGYRSLFVDFCIFDPAAPFVDHHVLIRKFLVFLIKICTGQQIRPDSVKLLPKPDVFLRFFTGTEVNVYVHAPGQDFFITF